MRKSALLFGSSQGSNHRVGDLASQSFIEREINRRKFPTIAETAINPIHIPTSNQNHAGRFIAATKNSKYAGYRGKFQGDDHFM